MTAPFWGYYMILRCGWEELLTNFGDFWLLQDFLFAAVWLFANISAGYFCWLLYLSVRRRRLERKQLIAAAAMLSADLFCGYVFFKAVEVWGGV